MEAALKALAEPRRRAILRLIRRGERTAGDIAGRFEVTRPAISHHLRVLREAGLIDERREGTRRYYRARVDAVRDLQRFFDRFWDAKLDDLKTTVERDRERRKRATS